MTPTVRRILLSQSLERKVQAIVRRNGIAMYVPTPGVTCFQDSACTTAANVDDPVGGLKDYLGLYPATQATSGYRPILRGKVKNWVQYSNQFDNGWIKNGVTLNGKTITDPFGVANNAWSMSFSNLGNGLYRDSIGLVNHTNSVWLKGPVGGEQIYLDVGGGVAKLLTLTTEWQRYSHTATPVGGSYFELRIDYPSALPNVTVHVFGAQSELGSVANPYIPTTSTPASSSYGPYWLDFDGVDDRLQLSNLTVGSSSYISLAAVNPLFGSSGSGFAFITGCHLADPEQYAAALFFHAGYIRALSNNAPSVEDIMLYTGGTSVVAGIMKNNGLLRARKNSISAINSITPIVDDSQTTGFIGRGPVDQACKMALHGITHLRLPASDADIILIEKYLAKLAGITI